MDLGEPPLFPSITLPEPYQLPKPILEVPRADIPYYKPLVVPPSDLRPPPGIKPDAKDEPPKETPKPQIPVVQPPPFKPPEIQTSKSGPWDGPSRLVGRSDARRTISHTSCRR